MSAQNEAGQRTGEACEIAAWRTDMKIAVFLPNWLGDLVMATPALRAVRRRYGAEARIVGILRPYLSDVLAGGGITGGQVYGSSDRLGEYPAEHPVTPADIAQTVYAAMGVHDLGAVDAEGRPFSLLDEGRPLMELF